jgi:RNA polymerase sigma-70 factor (ECF subfamily)
MQDIVSLVREYLRDGDEAKLRLIFNFVHPRLHAILRALGCPKDDLPDQVQIAEIAIHKNLGTFRGNLDTEFAAWSKRISLNKYIEHLRRRGREQRITVSMEALQEAAHEISDSKALNPRRATDWQIALEVLKKLPSPEREYALLSYAEGFTFKEIGSIFGKTEGAVKVALRRKLKSLGYDDGEID